MRSLTASKQPTTKYMGNDNNITDSLAVDSASAGSLSLVRQEDDSGCGLACVAMLAKCSYMHVRKIWLGLGGRDFDITAVNGGLSWYQLCHLMEVMAIKVPMPWETPRIIGVKGQPPLNNGHWVVVDESGKIFDPAND